MCLLVNARHAAHINNLIVGFDCLRAVEVGSKRRKSSAIYQSNDLGRQNLRVIIKLEGFVVFMTSLTKPNNKYGRHLIFSVIEIFKKKVVRLFR